MTYTINSTPPAKSKAPLAAPAKVLKKMTDEQRSGKVSVYDPEDSSIGWSVYFGGGQVHYAHSISGQRERLNYLIANHFARMQDVLTCNDTDPFESDYQWICERWHTQHLPLNIIRQILTTFTTEALTHILAMPQAKIELSSSIGLDPLLLSVPFRQLILPVREEINHWVTLQPTVKSPFSRFQITDPLNFKDPSIGVDGSEMNQLLRCLEADQFLYEIAKETHQSVDHLAQTLSALIGNGVLTPEPFQRSETGSQPVIACVDDSQTIQHFVKLALEPSGYDVVSLLDPTEALQALLDKQPQLILMDIEMPKLDGYELCKMVRQVEILRKTPVVMLTGREGLIDRVRAKMLGTSAYLTKPFNPTEMLALVQKLTKEHAVIAS